MLAIASRFDMEVAHFLPDHKGACKALHGHTYTFEIEISAPLNENGMIMDFKELKEIVRKEIVDRYDHAVVIRDKTAGDAVVLGHLNWITTKVVRVPFDPTAEMLLMEMVARLKSALPSGVEIQRATLHETRNNWAVYTR